MQIKWQNDIKYFKLIKDMRKAIDGLNSLVIEHLQLNPQEKYLFLFCNQQLSWLLSSFDFMNLVNYPELQFTDYC